MYLWPIGIAGNFEQGEGRGRGRVDLGRMTRLGEARGGLARLLSTGSCPTGCRESMGGRWGCRAQEWAELESQQSG